MFSTGKNTRSQSVESLSECDIVKLDENKSLGLNIKEELFMDVSEGERNELFPDGENLTDEPTAAAGTAGTIAFEAIDFSKIDEIECVQTVLPNTNNTLAHADLHIRNNCKNESVFIRSNEISGENLHLEHKDVNEKNSQDVNIFPSKEFLLCGGTGFSSTFSELQREVGLLFYKTLPTLLAIHHDVLFHVSQFHERPCKLHTVLHDSKFRLDQAEQMSKRLACSAEEIEVLTNLVKDACQLKENGEKIFLDEKLLIFSQSLCKVFQAFTTRFALRTTKPLVQLLKEEYAFATKVGNHTKCGCLTNPLLKFTQVEQNIPMSILPTWYRDSKAYCPHVAGMTEQLAVLGRGRRPNKIVFVIDPALYCDAAVTCFTSGNSSIIKKNLDSFSAFEAIKLHPLYSGDSVLYIVMASFGSLLAAIPDFLSAHVFVNTSSKFSNNSNGFGNEKCPTGDLGTYSNQPVDEAELSYSPLTKDLSDEDDKSSATEAAYTASDEDVPVETASLLSNGVIYGALHLWRAILCNTAESDMLFVPVPAPTPTAVEKLQDKKSAQTVMQHLSLIYNNWVGMQQRATGRVDPLHYFHSLTCNAQMLPSVENVALQLNKVLAQMHNDIVSYKKFDQPALVRCPPICQFTSVVLVVEEPFVPCVSAYVKQFKQVSVVSVLQLSPAHARTVLDAVQEQCGVSSLLVLVTSWLRPDAVQPSPDTDEEYPLFSIGGEEELDGGHKQVLNDLENLVSFLKEETSTSVVVLPCLPVHVLLKTKDTSLNLEDVTAASAAQVLVLEEKYDFDLSNSYRKFSREICQLVSKTFHNENLHCNYLTDFTDIIETEKISSLCSTSHRCPLLLSDLYGPFGQLLFDVVFSALSGFPSERLSTVDDLRFVPTYPGLASTANLETKSPRYSQVAVIGNEVHLNPLKTIFSGNEKVMMFSSIDFTDKSITEFLDKASRLPPNTLFIFLLDVTMLSKAEVYPDCITKKCSDPIIRYSLDPSIFVPDDSLLEEFVSALLKPVVQQISMLKKCMANQSSVIVSPMPPQRVLLQEESHNFFNHTLLHLTFYNECKNPMVYGRSQDWDMFYRYCVEELNKPCYVLDVGLENLVNCISAELKPCFSCVTNPRLYSEQPFPERVLWHEFMEEVISRVLKLVFPVAGISAEDISAISNNKNATSLVPSIKTTRPATASVTNAAPKPGTALHSSVPRSPTPYVAPNAASFTPCVLGTTPLGPSNTPCELIVDAGKTELPESVLNTIMSLFDPVGQPKNIVPSQWLVKVPDMVRAALLVAALDTFRCTFVLLTAKPIKLTAPLPPAPADKLRLVQTCLWERLRDFALKCDKQFFSTVIIDSSFLSARAASNDYVEGMDSTFLYLNRELCYLHEHMQKQIKEGLVLCVVVSPTYEDACCIERVLNTSLQCPSLYPRDGGMESPTIVSRDSHSNTGPVLVGTPRFVLAVLRSLPTDALRCLQLLLLEQLQLLMKTDQRVPLLELVAIAKKARTASNPMRTVVVSSKSSLEELSGANVMLDTRLRLIKRDDRGRGLVEEYDPDSLPKVFIRDNAAASAPAGPSSIATIGTGTRGSALTAPRMHYPGPNFGSSVRSAMKQLHPQIRPSSLIMISQNVRNTNPTMMSFRPNMRPVLRNIRPLGPTMQPMNQNRPSVRPMGPNISLVPGPPNYYRPPLRGSAPPPSGGAPNWGGGYSSQVSQYVPPRLAIVSAPFTFPPPTLPYTAGPPSSSTLYGASSMLHRLIGSSSAQASAGHNWTQKQSMAGSSRYIQQSQKPGNNPSQSSSYPAICQAGFGSSSMQQRSHSHGQLPPVLPSGCTPTAGASIIGQVEDAASNPVAIKSKPPFDVVPGATSAAKLKSGVAELYDPFSPSQDDIESSRKRSREVLRLSRSSSRSHSRSPYRSRRKDYRKLRSRRHSRSLSRSRSPYYKRYSDRSPKRRKQSRSYSRSGSESRYVSRSRSKSPNSRSRDKPGSVGTVRQDVAIIKSTAVHTIKRFECFQQSLLEEPLSIAAASSHAVKNTTVESAVGGLGAGTDTDAAVCRRGKETAEKTEEAEEEQEEDRWMEYGEDIITPSFKNRSPPHIPPSPSDEIAVEEERLFESLKAEYQTYVDDPERHPQCEEHREVFLDLYEQQFGGTSYDCEHKEREWNSVWQGMVDDLFQKELAKRKQQLAEEIKKRKLRESMAEKFRSRLALPTSSGLSTSSGASSNNNKSYHVNSSTGTSSSFYGDRIGNIDTSNRPSYLNSGNSSSTDPDLDPQSLSERTLGLSTVELAILIKQLITSKSLADPETSFKVLLENVTALHLQHAQKQAGGGW